MRNTFAVAMIACGVLSLACGSMASAQSLNPYTATTINTPTVSPYLNLGYTPSGLSNYQTLVKPMIDEQDAIAKQSATIERLQRQLQGTRDGKAAAGTAGRDAKSRDASGGRFMYYSHYFGPGR